MRAMMAMMTTAGGRRMTLRRGDRMETGRAARAMMVAGGIMAMAIMAVMAAGGGSAPSHTGRSITGARAKATGRATAMNGVENTSREDTVMWPATSTRTLDRI